MGVDLKDWLAYVRSHPLKFRFEGLSGRGRSRKDDFFETVGEAAVADERFMDDYFSDEFDSQAESFDAAVKAREDLDEMLSRFCEFVEHRMSARDWREHGFMSFDWDKAPIESIMVIVDAVGNKMRDDYIRDWVIGDPDPYWEMIKSKDQEEYLLKDHPPVACWSNAYDAEVDIEDVFFLCPSCREPQTEEGLTEMYGLQNGYPHFYCGSCGSEMCIDRSENILDFFNAMETTPYPFDTEKRELWQKRMADRKAWGENKHELKVGEKVHLRTFENVPYHNNAPDSNATWKHWKNEPGELVTITHVTNVTTKNGEVTTCAGIVTEEQGFVEFQAVYGRPKVEVPV